MGPRPRAGALSWEPDGAGGGVLPPREPHPHRGRPRAVGRFGEPTSHTPREAPDGHLREAGVAPTLQTRVSREGGGAGLRGAHPLVGFRPDLTLSRADRGERREGSLPR